MLIFAVRNGMQMATLESVFTRVCQTCYSTLTEGEEIQSDSTTSSRSQNDYDLLNQTDC